MKNINVLAPVKCSKSIRIQANPREVWMTLTDIAQWATWQTDISKVKLQGPLEVGTAFVWKTGGAKIHSTLHTVQPHCAFGWTGKALGTFAIHNWTLTENGNETEVTVTESMEGWLVTLLRRMFQKNLEAGMAKWLRFLQAESEARAGRRTT